MVKDDSLYQLKHISIIPMISTILKLVYRPGVARAVLQTALQFINYLSRSSFVKISSKCCPSQTVKARERMFTMWDMSHVTCHFVIFIFIFGNGGRVSLWRVCYQQGLTSLVFTDTD